MTIPMVSWYEIGMILQCHEKHIHFDVGVFIFHIAVIGKECLKVLEED